MHHFRQPSSMKKSCELGKCPGGCDDEVVVTCTGNTLGAAKQGVQCRFGSALATACVFEEESGTFTCTPPKARSSPSPLRRLFNAIADVTGRMPPASVLSKAAATQPLRRPQGLSIDELLNCQLFTENDVFLADLKDLPALQRCVLLTNKQESTSARFAPCCVHVTMAGCRLGNTAALHVRCRLCTLRTTLSRCTCLSVRSICTGAIVTTACMMVTMPDANLTVVATRPWPTPTSASSRRMRLSASKVRCQPQR